MKTAIVEKIVETKSGKVQGYSENGLEIFKGIPFAEPPIGDLRFLPPVAKKPWAEVLDATKYGPCAFQGYSELEEWFGKLQPESEDCLNLNIWTPAADNNKRPVMVWIHGGAFSIGGGTDPIYDGTTLSRRGDIVVVTINYRLGSFGFLYVPDEIVNVGSLDQIKALEWVRDNIELFGGDPNKITIFGESAGGYSVVSLCAMPAAKGLFHRVIAQSMPFIDTTVSDKTTKKIMRRLRVKGDLEAMREIPPEKIIDEQNKVFAADPTNIMALRPLIIGDTFPKHPLKVFQNGDCKDIDFMIGTNLDEFKLFTAMEPLKTMMEAGSEKVEERIIGFLTTMGMDANKSKEILTTYKKAREGKSSTDPKDIMTALITDVAFRIPTIRLLEAQRPHQPNTYNYMFTWPSPGLDGILGACHALELPFVFGSLDLPNMDEFAGKGPDVETLSKKMMDAWIAFARTGNPNHDGIPEWPSYDVEKRSTMFLGKECKAVNAAFDNEREAWDGLLEI